MVVYMLCCFALFVCLTLLASFFLSSHLSFKNMHVVSKTISPLFTTLELGLVPDAFFSHCNLFSYSPSLSAAVTPCLFVCLSPGARRLARPGTQYNGGCTSLYYTQIGNSNLTIIIIIIIKVVTYKIYALL